MRRFLLLAAVTSLCTAASAQAPAQFPDKPIRFILGFAAGGPTGSQRAGTGRRGGKAGLGENAMLHACTLGRKIGLVTIHPIHIPYHEDQVLRYGLQQRVVAVAAVESAANDYVLAFGDPKVAKAIAAKYTKEIKALVARGVEVVIPAGGLPSLLFGAALKVSTAPAVVLDSVALATKSAELAVDLKRFNGTAPSRASTFALPWPAALEALGMGTPASKRKPK